MSKKYIFISILVVGGIATASLWPKNNTTLYETEPLTSVDIQQTVSVTGSVRPRTTIPLRVQMSGDIHHINTSVGQRVKKGDLLLSLDQESFEIEIQQAEARRAIAEANLAQRLAGVRQEDASVSAKAVKNAEANLAAAKLRLKSRQEIFSVEEEQALLAISIAETQLKDSTTQFQNTASTNETSIQLSQSNVESAYANAKSPINQTLSTIQKLLTKADDLLKISQKRQSIQYSFGNTLLENKAKNKTRSLLLDLENTEKKYQEQETNNENIKSLLTEADKLIDNGQSLARDLYTLLSQTKSTSKTSEKSIQTDLTEVNTLQTTLTNTLTSIRQSQQSITSAELTLKNQRETLKANRDGSREVFNSAKAALKNAQKSLDILRITHQKNIESAQNDIQIAQTQLEQAQAAYSLKIAAPREVDIAALRAQVQSEKAALSLAQKRRKDAQIIAPIDGIITSINAEIGEQVSPTQTLITVMDDTLYIQANVSETDIAKVKKDQPVTMTFDALSLNETFQGTVNKINPAETVIQGVIYYQIEVNFDNDGRIKSGMTANLDIQTGHKKDVLAVSPQAIIYEDNKPFVRVLENKEAVKKEVTIGLEGDMYIEILTGVNEGDTIILFEK